MIHLDLSKIVSLQKIKMFETIRAQLIDQAGIYKHRVTTEPKPGAIKREPGDEVFIGEKMNIYVDHAGPQLWIFKKPEIDG